MKKVVKKQIVRQKRLKKGDEVIVVAGKDKSKRGVIQQVKYYNNGRIKVLVDGVNIIKKHVKPNPQAGQPGGIQERSAFLDISNVQIFNRTTNKGDRVGFKFLDDGRKVRCFKSSGEIIDVDQG